MSRTVCAALLALTLSGVLAAPAPAAAPSGPSPDLVISEVFGAGGNSGSDYPVDYVELFNRGPATVSLNGKSLQYASATGTGAFGSITTLTGDVAPGQYVLVQAGSAPVAGDIALAANLSGTGGKVVLANGTSSLGCNTAASCAANGSDSRIIDLVGYGSANFFEGAGPALGASTTMSTKRNAEGCVEIGQQRLLPQSERYSYIFQGNAQVLDHILVSPALFVGGRPDFDAVHINAEFEDQASDHDPPITRLHVTGDDKDDDRDDDD